MIPKQYDQYRLLLRNWKPVEKITWVFVYRAMSYIIHKSCLICPNSFSLYFYNLYIIGKKRLYSIQIRCTVFIASWYINVFLCYFWCVCVCVCVFTICILGMKDYKCTLYLPEKIFFIFYVLFIVIIIIIIFEKNCISSRNIEILGSVCQNKNLLLSVGKSYIFHSNQCILNRYYYWV